MKRTAQFVGLALTITLAATLVDVNRASGRSNGDSSAAHDHGQNQHSNHQSNAQRPQPFVDGATNPGAIPDSAAREIVLRLLTSDELNEGAKRAYLKVVGFDEAASAALTFAAHDFKRQTKQIEKEASDIKDKTWPNPDKAALDSLAGLQRQKEAVLANNAAELDERLRSFNALANWEKYILNRVKRKTKGFKVGMPEKKVSFYQKIFDPFTAFAQAPGCDANVYVYSDTYVDWDYFIVYGTGSYSVPTNNCGHTFTQSSTLWGPGGTGGWGNSISLDTGTGFLDGYFQSNTSLEGFCPVVSQTFSAGSNASDMTLSPYLIVGSFDAFAPNSIAVGGDNSVSGIRISVTASQNANGSFNTEFSYEVVQGLAPMDFHLAGSGNKSISGGATIPVPFALIAEKITSSPTRIKARAIVTSSITVKNGDQTSTSILNVSF
jgi:hypothetical protein